MSITDWIDAFIADVETVDDGKEEATPLPRTESGTPTMPPLTEASAFRTFSSFLPKLSDPAWMLPFLNRYGGGCLPQGLKV